MPIVNKIIPGIDLPVYEFLRPSFSHNQVQAIPFFSIPGGKSRFMYAWSEGGDGIPYRYDAYSDMTQRLPATPRVANNLASYAYLNRGYCGAVITASLSSISFAAQDSNQSFIGKTIRITRGPGKNQERKIVSLSEPIAENVFAITTGNYGQGTNAGAVDWGQTGALWIPNQYKGYEAKIIFGTGYGLVRPILGNSNTQMNLTNPALFGYPGYSFANNFVPTSILSNATMQVQYSIATIDQPWNIIPTADSLFEIIDSGGKLCLMYNGDSPFTYFEIDLCTQLVEYKSIYGLRTTVFGTDYDICGGFPSDTPSVSAFVTSASTLFFADSGNTYSSPFFNNYQVKIQSGTGAGQIRHITSTALSGYTIDLPWDVIPDQTSIYTINNNDRIIYGIGGSTDSRLYTYHSEYEIWSHHSYVMDFGFTSTLVATHSASEGVIPISTITRTGNVALASTLRPHLISFNRPDGSMTVTVTGCSDPLYNGTFIAISGVAGNNFNFTYNMAGTPAANATAVNTNTTTRIFDLTKNWTTNQWVSAICYIYNGVQQNQFGSGNSPPLQARIIQNNDNISLTLRGALSFTPANGSRYYIFPLKPVGIDETEGTSLSKLAYGVVTTAGTTTITDASKNWQPGIHVNKRCLILAGTGAGTEATITANTSNVLTCSITTDTTSVYAILGNVPVNNAGIVLENAYNTTTNKGKYLYFNRGGTVPMFGQRYNIATQTWETHAYSTFASNASQQNDSRWPYGASNGGQCSVYDGNDRIYFNVGGNQRRIWYLDLKDDQIYTAGIYPYANSNNTYTGSRHFGLLNVDGVKFIYMHRCGSSTDAYRFIPTY